LQKTFYERLPPTSERFQGKLICLYFKSEICAYAIPVLLAFDFIGFFSFFEFWTKQDLPLIAIAGSFAAKTRHLYTVF
jgi:hypothetical protein